MAKLVTFGKGTWADLHNSAVLEPRLDERGIVETCVGLEAMAKSYSRRFEAPIGNDGVLGDCWIGILRGIRGMLNGETGRLDCGTVDAFLVALARENGFTDEDL